MQPHDIRPRRTAAAQKLFGVFGGPRGACVQAAGSSACVAVLDDERFPDACAPWQRCTVHFLRDCLGQPRLPKVAGLLEQAEDDILAFYAFPEARRKLRSTNRLERFDREIGRRTDVVGTSPDDRSQRRMAGRPLR